MKPMTPKTMPSIIPTGASSPELVNKVKTLLVIQTILSFSASI